MSLPKQIFPNRMTPMFAVICVGLIALTSGCCGIGCGPCGVGGGYHGGAVVDAGCGPACGPGTCSNNCGLRNLVYPLISPRLCGSGCGDIYWNEWACDPPDCCDPCNAMGCHVGPQVCYSPPLIVSAIHCVGRGVSDLLGVILGGIGCGPCNLLCGGCGSCGGAIHAGYGGCEVGCASGGCGAGGCCGDCASNATGQTVIQENPLQGQLTAKKGLPFIGRSGVVSANHQIRAGHGRPPHRAFSRRFR